MYSIRSRFIVSLITNILRGGISFITLLMLARWLGPTDYGRMIFLLSSFIAIKQLLDMSSSSAFFTFISQKQRSKTFVGYYFRWLGIQFFILLLLVSLLVLLGWADVIWSSETPALIFLAMMAAFMQQGVWPVVVQMAEASRETIRIQILNTFIVAFYLFTVILLWFFGVLSVPVLLVAVILEWTIAAWLAVHLYKRDKPLIGNNDSFSSVWNKYKLYCLPLIPLTIMGFAHDFGDRWMLQHWGGAEQQAYFSVAQQFSAVALLATTSILKIFWKEIAEAHQQNNTGRLKRLYWKVTRILFFIASIMAGAIIPWTNELIRLMLGENYITASFVLMVMFLYPVHQCIGQITGAYMLATSMTFLYLKIGVLTMLCGLIASYFMVAPATAFLPGMGLAAEGVAIKMVLIQIISVNIAAWYISKINSWRFDFIFQFICLFGAIFLGQLLKDSIDYLFDFSLYLSVFLFFIFYGVIILFALNKMPSLAGFDRIDVDNMKNILFKKRL